MVNCENCNASMAPGILKESMSDGVVWIDMYGLDELKREMPVEAHLCEECGRIQLQISLQQIASANERLSFR